jgi:hypothetical protein
MTPAPASRSLQRRLLTGLGALILLATGWPLLRPPQPPLPELPASLQLPDGWSEAPPIRGVAQSTPSVPAAAPVPRARRFHPLGRPAAFGPSRTLLGPEGKWLLLTPFASWTESGFSMKAARQGMPALPGQPQQRCLSSKGRVGTDPLPVLIGWNERPLSTLERLIHMVVPVRNRSYACLLITTNAPGLLDDSRFSKGLGAQLTAAVTWPDPPGL